MSGKLSILGHLVLHLIVVIFLAFPVWVTFMLPTTWIDLKRRDNQVNLDARICLLFVIPFQTVRVEGVEKVATKPGTVKVNATEGPKMLVLEGTGDTAELPVSIRAAGKFVDRINAFLASSDAKLSLRSTAHLGISIFCGIWAAIFISVYAIYLLSWLVPHSLQWRFLEWVAGRLPLNNRVRTEIEAFRRDSLTSQPAPRGRAGRARGRE